jgi:uncharacterized protein
VAKNFGAIAYSHAAKEMQERHGSRASYARMESKTYIDGLTENEVDFIQQRDSFYMASTGEKGFPYIQHRGGPKGFLKVLDSRRLGFIDFRGNMQYITVGNMATNNKVALIMVDYPTRSRLKIYASASVVELKNDKSLYDLLDLEEYKFRPEHMIVLDIEAYDWNCPQHITPRYTVEEIELAFASKKDYILSLENEIKSLKENIKNHDNG